MLIAFHKPFGVLSQFTPLAAAVPPAFHSFVLTPHVPTQLTAPVASHRSLAEFHLPPGVYPLGRLDADSEGLLLLSDEPEWNEQLLHPRHGHRRVYWAQVERIPAAKALRQLEQGVVVQGRKTLPCRAWILEPQPEVPPRTPPIRFRKTVPDCWLGLELREGKNRQVRRMTAAIGHPTLRLLRVQIGGFKLGDLSPGHWKILNGDERALVLQ